MEQLTLEQAAEANANGWLIPTVGALKGSFKKGAEWQKEQYKTKAKEIGDKMSYPNKYIFESIITQLMQND